MKVNGKDDIPYIMENKKCSKPPTSHQGGCGYWSNEYSHSGRGYKDDGDDKDGKDDEDEHEEEEDDDHDHDSSPAFGCHPPPWNPDAPPLDRCPMRFGNPGATTAGSNTQLRRAKMTSSCHVALMAVAPRKRT